MPPLVRPGLLLLASLLLLVSTVKGQPEPLAFSNPNYYFDFSQIKSSGPSNFVVDQVTKNPNAAFTFEGKAKTSNLFLAARSSACVGSGMSSPTYGPDGVVFSRDRQSIRLQYAENIDLGSRW
jgi:hypothetical protein